MKGDWDFLRCSSLEKALRLRDPSWVKARRPAGGLAGSVCVLVYFSVGLFQLRVIWGEVRSKQGGGETSMVGMGPAIPGPALRGVDVPSGASEPVRTGEV